MNRILSLIGVVLVVGCSEPIPRNIDELITQGETYLDLETLEPYSGPVFELFDVDPPKIQYRFNLKDGVKDGPYEDYFEDGQLRTKETYKDGELDGPSIVYTYWDNGQLRIKGTYKDGELDGPYEVYGENGQLEGKDTYVAGERDGPSERYYENGQLESKSVWNMGEQCGEWIIEGLTVATYDPCPPGLEDGN